MQFVKKIVDIKATLNMHSHIIEWCENIPDGNFFTNMTLFCQTEPWRKQGKNAEELKDINKD